MAIDTEKLVHNSLLTIVARGAMIVAAGCMPVAFWMMERVVNSNDAVGQKVDLSAVQIQLLQQDIKYGFDAAKNEITGIRVQLSDHEGRLRIIEREGPRNRLPN